MPRRALRLRVGGLTLSVTAAAPTARLDPPAGFRPFLASRGGGIRLRLREAPVPEPRSEDALFRSGGVWSVFRFGAGLLYRFRTAAASPPVYKGVVIDASLERGILFFPLPRDRRGPRYALDYPLDELLFQHRLAREGGLEIHACGVVTSGRVALFCGKSGAGKSTTARLWRCHRPQARILSDDRIVLRPTGRGVMAYGTPWHGDGGFAAQAKARLGAIFFLKKARRSRTRVIPPAAAAARLLARSFPPPWDAEALARSLDTAAKAVEAVPCFELCFRRDVTAVQAALAALAS